MHLSEWLITAQADAIRDPRPGDAVLIDGADDAWDSDGEDESDEEKAPIDGRRGRVTGPAEAERWRVRLDGEQSWAGKSNAR